MKYIRKFYRFICSLLFLCLKRRFINNEFNFMSKDIMPLDIWGKPEYDTERVLSHENEKRRNKTKDDKIVFFSLSSSCLTRRSRNHEYRMESGRSMVEMLGVLAVIGVLVIGATMGFEYAMDKYKANEIVHEAGLRASDIFHRYQTVPFPEVGTFGGYENCQNDFAEWSAETQIGYTMNTCAIKDEEGTDLAFAISVKDVPQGVCRRLTDMEPHKYMDGFRYMVIDGNRYTDGRSDICKSEIQDVVFVMLLDGEFEECIGDNCGEACIFDDDCRAVCNCAICDKDTKTCILPFTEEGEPQVCNEGICEPTEQCLSGVGFRAASGVCVPCTGGGDYALNASDEVFKIERDGVVVIEDLETPSALCRACGGEWRVNEIGENNIHCSTRCPFGGGYVPFTWDDSTINQYEFLFGSDKYTNNEQYENKCITATNPYNYRIVREDEKPACEALPNHYLFKSPVYRKFTFCGHECVNGSSFLGFIENLSQECRGGSCLSCNHTGAVIINDDKHRRQCHDCGMMVMGISDDVTVCAPACSGGTFVKLPGYDGNIFNNGSCQSCMTEGEVVVLYGSGTNNVITPSGTSDQTVYEYVKASCEACGNRKFIQQDGVYLCVNKDIGCAPDEFLGNDSACYKCSETAPIKIGSDEGSGCSTICNGQSIDTNGDGVNDTLKTKRRVINITGKNTYYCAPDVCVEGEFQAGDGTCHKCDEDNPVYISINDSDFYASALEPLRTECSSRCLVNGKETRYSDYYSKCRKIPTCPAGQFWAGSTGKCIDCGTAGAQLMYGMAQTDARTSCNACPTNVSSTNKGRTYRPHANNEGRAWNSSYCTLINPGVSGSCNSLGDYEGENPYLAGDGKFFRREPDGACVPCDTTEDVSLARDDGSQNYTVQCGTCGDVRVLNGTTCSLNLDCSEGASFWNADTSRCMLCTAATGNKYKTTYEKRGLCTGCGLRFMQVNETVAGEDTTTYYCAKKCVNNEWQDSEGNCISCDSDASAGDYIGSDYESQRLCTACNWKVTKDHNGDLMCEKSSE